MFPHETLINRLGCDFYKEAVGFALGLAKFAAGTNFTRLAKRETDDGFTEN